ncbi:MAG: bifunctional DNA-formamidopyrimidine glycosylase/DNA-(apurinic or apyrimidinic site) lyase [Gemmatimonadota bacterium]|nr:bifunctional DNA-formamidopyrimidine glycosylase/DNA-(apurinic or apyrimidinic site) lyase [Gemmatimonadota bacterium]MDH3421688.1 bifunctional DNA-formamidopyrimidine glycosylase/DNA-(apurinic or apyrimidinic site) lyase [Gemmatimonadota bacterium]
MPELPEAETIVRGLRPAVVGRTIRGTQVLHSDVLREARDRFTRRVRGRRIVEVGRRGKNVLLQLDGERVVAVNLGMTGRLLPTAGRTPDSSPGAHPAVRFRLDDGKALVFDDTRRFGTVECLDHDEWHRRSRRMGPEPLEAAFTGGVLHAGLRESRSPLRSWLLDQRKIAGIGNIYANEALFLAGVHPQRLAKSVSRNEAAALHRGIRRVLRNAIESGGTTLRDYRTASGEEGRYARRLLVYGRDGESCSRCRTEIHRVVFGGRSAFYCPKCQPRRGARA